MGGGDNWGHPQTPGRRLLLHLFSDFKFRIWCEQHPRGSAPLHAPAGGTGEISNQSLFVKEGVQRVADASFRAGLSYDNEYLYIAMQTRDDKTILDATRYPWEQDGVEVRIDARADPARSRGRGGNDFIDHLIISIAPPAQAGGKPVIFRPDELPAGSKYAAVRNDEGIAMEAAIPVAWLNAQQKTDWKAVRVNFTQHDHDTEELGNSTHLYWRPDWRADRNVEGSGTFLKH